MTPITPLFIFLLSSALYFFVGFRLGEKTYADPEDARAWRAFGWWWYGMGANTALDAMAILFHTAGITNLSLYVAFNLGLTLAAVVALWGLLTYLTYIFTGSQRGSRWLGAFYIAFFVFLVISIFSFRPSGAVMGAWAVTLQYANVPQGVYAWIYGSALILLMSLPPILASFGMFSLFFRIQERSARYRALLVPLGIFGLFGLSYLIPLLLLLLGFNLNQVAWWPLTVRVLGITSLLLIYFAYFPPGVIRRRLQVRTVLG